jgi:hypothetical protein
VACSEALSSTEWSTVMPRAKIRLHRPPGYAHRNKSRARAWARAVMMTLSRSHDGCSLSVRLRCQQLTPVSAEYFPSVFPAAKKRVIPLAVKFRGLSFDPEDGGSAFLRNVCQLVLDYTVSHPRILWPFSRASKHSGGTGGEALPWSKGAGGCTSLLTPSDAGVKAFLHVSS